MHHSDGFIPPYELSQLFTPTNTHLLPHLVKLARVFECTITPSPPTPHFENCGPHDAEMIETFYEFFPSIYCLTRFLRAVDQFAAPRCVGEYKNDEVTRAYEYWFTEDSPRPPYVPTEEIIDQLPSTTWEVGGLQTTIFAKSAAKAHLMSFSTVGRFGSPLTYIYRTQQWYDPYTGQYLKPRDYGDLTPIPE